MDTDIYFTAKVAGEVEKTKDLAVVERWREQGRLVLAGQFYSRGWRHSDDIVMTKGKREKRICSGKSDIADICVELWKKGYRISKPEKEKEKRVATFQETLTSVADVLEPTNAQKAAYFRNAIPYEIRYHNAKLLVVDFPTHGNSLKRTVEKFQLAGKPSNVTTLNHGTKLRYVPSIVKRGLKRSRWGRMLGHGIYLGHLEKARNYSDLIIFEVKVVLGRCKELGRVEELGNNSEWDSMHAGAGNMTGVYKGWLANEEWVVRYPEQVEISRLICDVEWKK